MGKIVSAIAGKLNHIGRAGENLATTVLFDVSDWKEPGDSFAGIFHLYIQQNGVGYYIQSVTQPADSSNGNTVLWDVTNSNTATIGVGKAELVYSEPTNQDKPTIVGTYDNNAFYAPGIGIIFYEENGKKYITEHANVFYIYVDENSSKKYYIEGGSYFEVDGVDDPHLKTDKVIKSVIYDIVVTTSLDNESATEVPDPIQVWLQELLSMTNEIKMALPYAHISERYAAGTEDGQTISSGIGYNNNSKYWSEQAATSATNASNSASNAATIENNISNNVFAEAITLEPSENASASVIYNNGLNFSFGIPRGQSFTVKNHVDTEQELYQIPNPSLGDGYSVGATIPYDVYIYCRTSNLTTTWLNFGPLTSSIIKRYDWSNS